MAGFKSAPAKKRMLFRKAKVLAKTAPVKHALARKTTTAPKAVAKAVTKAAARPAASATTKSVLAQARAQFPKIALSKGTAQVVNNVFAQVKQEVRRRRAQKKSLTSVSVSSSLDGSMIATVVVMLHIFAVMLWGLARSGQEMVAGSADRAAGKVYFGFMVALAILYVVFNVVGGALVADAGSVVIESVESGSADPDDAVRFVQDGLGASAMYTLSGLVGLPLLIMAIVALARLGPNKK